MLSLIISEEAWRDIIAIGAYTDREWSSVQADNYVASVLDKIEVLSEVPKLGVACSHLVEDMRCVTVLKHSVFYLLTKKQIRVIRVLHQSQDPKRHVK